MLIGRTTYCLLGKLGMQNEQGKIQDHAVLTHRRSPFIKSPLDMTCQCWLTFFLPEISAPTDLPSRHKVSDDAFRCDRCRSFPGLGRNIGSARTGIARMRGRRAAR